MICSVLSLTVPAPLACASHVCIRRGLPLLFLKRKARPSGTNSTSVSGRNPNRFRYSSGMVTWPFEVIFMWSLTRKSNTTPPVRLSTALWATNQQGGEAQPEFMTIIKPITVGIPHDTTVLSKTKLLSAKRECVLSFIARHSPQPASLTLHDITNARGVRIARGDVLHQKRGKSFYLPNPQLVIIRLSQGR